MAEIDPSYVTLIERDGYVPKKDKVERLATALNADLDHTLLMAGYAPQQVSMSDILSKIESVRAKEELDAELRVCIRELYTLNSSQQRKVAEVLRSYVRTLKEKEQERVTARAMAGRRMKTARA